MILQNVILDKCPSCEEITETRSTIYGVLCELCYDEREQEYLEDYSYDEEQEAFIREYLNIPEIYEIHLLESEEPIYFVLEHNSVHSQSQTFEDALKSLYERASRTDNDLMNIGLEWFLKQHPKHKTKKVFEITLNDLKEQKPELFL